MLMIKTYIECYFVNTSDLIKNLMYLEANILRLSVKKPISSIVFMIEPKKHYY